MRPLSSRESKIVALGLAVALCGLIYLLIIGPVIAGFQNRAAERRFLLLRYEQNNRLIASTPQLRLRAETQIASASRFMVEAATPDAASEYLKERLRREITNAGGALKGSDTLEGTPGWVHVWAEAEMTLPQMTMVLQRLRSNPPYLVTESLNVVADRALATGHLEPMDVKIEVSIPYSMAAKR